MEDMVRRLCLATEGGEFESVIRKELYLWQDMREFVGSAPVMSLASDSELDALIGAFSNDPLFKAPNLVIDLR